MRKDCDYSMDNQDRNTQLIFNSYIARELLHMGNPIVDILKNHKLVNAVVFVFEKTDKFEKDYSHFQSF